MDVGQDALGRGGARFLSAPVGKSHWLCVLNWRLSKLLVWSEVMFVEQARGGGLIRKQLPTLPITRS